jgi:hypothetical protein
MADVGEPGPIRIAPPFPVRVAALGVLLHAVAVLTVAGASLLARRDATVQWALATTAYFLVLATAMTAVAAGLLRGRRWARTPAVVIELIVALVGIYVAGPSEQLLVGSLLIASGGVTLALLVSGPANEWIRSFPPLFGPAPDQ